MRVLARDVAAGIKGADSGEIELSGWVHRIWAVENVGFVILRDRSAEIQLVFGGDYPLPRDTPLTPESLISVSGIPVLNEKIPGGVEIAVRSIKILSQAVRELPFQVNGDVSKSSLDSILDNRFLSLRSPKILSIFRVQATIMEAFAAYLRKEDFTEIKSSKLVLSATEEAANLFRTEYFDSTLYLAQSSRFYRQIMVAAGLERIFEIGPAFRAEKHDTPRHLGEFISLDVEMGFIENEKDLIKLEKDLLAHIFSEVERKNKKDLDAWNARVPQPEAVIRSPTVTYEESLSIANREAARDNSSGGRIFDITPRAEQLLCEWALREKGVDLVFVNEFPRRYRPFYTFPLSVGFSAAEGAALTMSFDCLFRGMEITSGCRRHDNYNALLEALPLFGLKPDDQKEYLELLTYGCPPHGGFAIGLERLTLKILGLSSVKEASLFPRDSKRMAP